MFHRDFLQFRSVFCISTIVCLAALAGCASIGTPGGGLYDETPPVYRSSKPAEGAVEVRDRKITIHFDENIKLSNVMEKLTVSPPQEKAPTVLSNAKTVTVELQDTLIPNATYTLDFGNAIQDNNEGNELEHFALTFSTGTHIDSLRISGFLLNAEDLEPITGAYVGIYPDTMMVGDSAFLSRPLLRAGKSDALGAFTINGVAPGRYKLYALNDGNTNYRYDLYTEDIAFLDSLVVPSATHIWVPDTVWVDSLTIDTIKSREATLYAPSNLRLFMFNEQKYNRYLDDNARPDSARLTFRFSAPMPELPTLTVIGEEEPLSAPRLLAEPNHTLDTLTFWLGDSLLYSRDTLTVAATYYYTDTLSRDVLRTDTLSFVRPVERKQAEGGFLSNLKSKSNKRGVSRSKKKGEADADSVPQIQYMTLKALTGSALNIGQRPRFEYSAPIAVLDTAGIHLNVKSDSVWYPIDYTWIDDTTHLRRFELQALPHFTPGHSYQLVVDSAAIHDIFGHPIAKTTLEFKEHTPEEYAHLLFKVKGLDGAGFVQLLNEHDKPVQTATVLQGQAKFVNVLPGTYYARVVEDTNGNGRFDVGNLSEHRQPERVYYFDGTLTLRANWQFSQEIDLHALDVIKQKPNAVKINKPKEKEEKKSRNEEYLEKMRRRSK
jgi:hypothetical protein